MGLQSEGMPNATDRHPIQSHRLAHIARAPMRRALRLGLQRADDDRFHLFVGDFSLRSGRGSSYRPSRRSRTNRPRHFDTVAGVTCSRRATTLPSAPSAHAKMIRARRARAAADRDRCASDSSRCRSSAVTFSGASRGGAATVPSSFQTILHEVGHAVEKEVLRNALDEVNKSSAEVDVIRKRITDANTTYDADKAEATKNKKLGQFYKAREDALKKNEADAAKAQAKHQVQVRNVDATRVPAAVVQPFETDAAVLQTAASTALTNAQAAVKAMTADEIQRSSNAASLVDATAVAIIAFATNAKSGTAPIDDLELVVYQQVFDRDRARVELMKLRPGDRHTQRAVFPLDAAAESQDLWLEAERAVARARLRTLRLQQFVDLVVSNNIRRFTQYSVDNWQLKPEEFCAEAERDVYVR